MAPIRGTLAMVAPVAGSTTGKVAPESASTQVPSMYACSRRRSVSSAAMSMTIATVNPDLSDGGRRWDNPCMGAQFIRFADVPAFNLVVGVEGRPLFGEGAMVNLIEFDAGAT